MPAYDKPIRLRKRYTGYRDPQVTSATKVMPKETQSQVSRRRYKALTGKDAPESFRPKGVVKLGPKDGKIKRVDPEKEKQLTRDEKTRKQIRTA